MNPYLKYRITLEADKGEDLDEVAHDAINLAWALDCVVYIRYAGYVVGVGKKMGIAEVVYNWPDDKEVSS